MSDTQTPSTLEDAVRRRYSEASKQREASLCCPVDYDPKYLEVIPQEVLDRDYGCGDPSAWVGEGETVLDLGSGGGKICFIAAQVVGRRGRVIGVDFGEDMLVLAENARLQVAERLGFDNVEFRRGRIQDLQLDLASLDRELAGAPLGGADVYLKMQSMVDTLRRTQPLVETDSVDVVVSNCVLNLVPPAEKPTLFQEIHRVLKRGGRAVISDIVADEPVPEHLQQDADLFSGCISGALTETEFLQAFADAGLYGVEILKRDEAPWAVVEGLEFRSVTVRAFKGKEGPCRDTHQAVIYNGPWKSVTDDDGHTLFRGQRMAVCEKTFRIYTREPYAESIVAVSPRVPVPESEAGLFACDTDAVRPVKVTKGQDYQATVEPVDSCGPEGCC